MDGSSVSNLTAQLRAGTILTIEWVSVTTCPVFPTKYAFTHTGAAALSRAAYDAGARERVAVVLLTYRIGPRHHEACTTARKPRVNDPVVRGSAAGDVGSGVNTSVACQACHGGNGISISAEIPNLAGQKAEYIAQQLKAFKSGERKHDVMNPIAKQLSDGDIANLAAFWNSLPSAGSDREAAPAAALARKATMDFPAGFPAGFTVYRTDESAEEKSVSSYYANAAALNAARAGRALPDGSIIVVAMSRARLGADQKPLTDGKGHLVADVPNFYSAMEARTGAGDGLPDLLRNGNWTYGLFNAQRVRGDKNNYALCFGCHKAVERDSYVFTLKQLAEKAKGS